MLPELPKAVEHINIGAGVQTQQIWLQGLCYLILSEARSWRNTPLYVADGGQDMAYNYFYNLILSCFQGQQLLECVLVYLSVIFNVTVHGRNPLKNQLVL